MGLQISLDLIGQQGISNVSGPKTLRPKIHKRSSRIKDADILNDQMNTFNNKDTCLLGLFTNSALRAYLNRSNFSNDWDTFEGNGLDTSRLIETDENGILTGVRKALQIKPQVESRIRHRFNVEAHLTQTADNVVTLLLEVLLQSLHFGAHLVWLEHGDRGFLEGNVRTTVQVGATGPDCFDEFLFSSAGSSIPFYGRK